jgi:hypothetical protein
MLPRVPLRRLLGALGASVALTALGCGDNTIQITACGTPTLTEMGADGGPDPCHCDPPSSLGIMACACLSGDQQDIDAFQSCMALFNLEKDAGVGGAH